MRTRCSAGGLVLVVGRPEVCDPAMDGLARPSNELLGRSCFYATGVHAPAHRKICHPDLRWHIAAHGCDVRFLCSAGRNNVRLAFSNRGFQPVDAPGNRDGDSLAGKRNIWHRYLARHETGMAGRCLLAGGHILARSGRTIGRTGCAARHAGRFGRLQPQRPLARRGCIIGACRGYVAGWRRGCHRDRGLPAGSGVGILSIAGAVLHRNVIDGRNCRRRGGVLVRPSLLP